MNLPPLVIVDGMNLLWRAAFGFPARIRDSEGEDVTPAFGFFALLRKAIHGLAPCEAVVVFDGEGSSDARVEMAPDYKANRADADYSHLAWLPAIYEGLQTAGLGFEETTGAEADDVIAELVRRVGSGRPSVIVSADRDFYQLLKDHVVIANTMRKSGEQIVDGDEVRRRFGVEPWQWCDYMALGRGHLGQHSRAFVESVQSAPQPRWPADTRSRASTASSIRRGGDAISTEACLKR